MLVTGWKGKGCFFHSQIHVRMKPTLWTDIFVPIWCTFKTAEASVKSYGICSRAASFPWKTIFCKCSGSVKLLYWTIRWKFCLAFRKQVTLKEMPCWIGSVVYLPWYSASWSSNKTCNSGKHVSLAAFGCPFSPSQVPPMHSACIGGVRGHPPATPFSKSCLVLLESTNAVCLHSRVSSKFLKFTDCCLKKFLFCFKLI